MIRRLWLFIWFYELISLKTTVGIISHSNSSIIFGFTTPTDHGSDSIITLTLFWEDFKYQCNVYPTEYNTSYSCNTSNTTTTSQCDSSFTSNPIQYGLQIDNDDWDDLSIDSITIQIIEDDIIQNIYTFEYFCLSLNISHNINQTTYCDNTLSITAPHLIPINISASSILETYIQIQPESARCVPDMLQSDLHKYVLVPLPKTWIEAQTYCKENMNSNLATLISDQDLAVAVSIRDSNDEYFDNGIWIGLTDNALMSDEGEWKWIDATSCNYTSTGLCIDDIHWAPNEPNEDNDEDCAEIAYQYTFGLFNDIGCTEKRIFLCNNASFVSTITTQEPQITTVTGDTDSHSVYHVDTDHTYIIVYCAVIVAVLLVIGCICVWFLGKKWLKELIRQETEKQRQSDSNIVKDMNGSFGARRKTFTFEPGRNIINRNTSVSTISSNGYIGVSKESDDDEEKTTMEGYVRETNYKMEGTNGNKASINDVINVLIKKLPQVNNMEYIEEKESSSDSEDLYNDALNLEDKVTSTPIMMGTESMKVTQEGTYVHTNNITACEGNNIINIEDPNIHSIPKVN